MWHYIYKIDFDKILGGCYGTPLIYAIGLYHMYDEEKMTKKWSNIIIG